MIIITYCYYIVTSFFLSGCQSLEESRFPKGDEKQFVSCSIGQSEHTSVSTVAPPYYVYEASYIDNFFKIIDRKGFSFAFSTDEICFFDR
jgi:hypothetical protein